MQCFAQHHYHPQVKTVRFPTLPAASKAADNFSQFSNIQCYDGARYKKKRKSIRIKKENFKYSNL